MTSGNLKSSSTFLKWISGFIFSDHIWHHCLYLHCSSSSLSFAFLLLSLDSVVHPSDSFCFLLAVYSSFFPFWQNTNLWVYLDHCTLSNAPKQFIVTKERNTLPGCWTPFKFMSKNFKRALELLNDNLTVFPSSLSHSPRQYAHTFFFPLKPPTYLFYSSL